ncbi:MAG: hypothetical protein QXQ38_07690 [Archaeoglobaceae archaeon]
MADKKAIVANERLRTAVDSTALFLCFSFDIIGKGTRIERRAGIKTAKMN